MLVAHKKTQVYAQTKLQNQNLPTTLDALYNIGWISLWLKTTFAYPLPGKKNVLFWMSTFESHTVDADKPKLLLSCIWKSAGFRMGLPSILI